MAKKSNKTAVSSDEQPRADDRRTDEAEPTAAETKPVVADQPQPKVVKSSITKPRRAVPSWVWIIVGAAVLGGAAAIGWMINRPAATKTASTVNTTTAAAQLVPRLLDGMLVPPNQAKTNTYAIMIENIAESRPPSALDKASVVYEVLAEGGITRFLALYPVGGDRLTQIGPVRSARPYYITWAEEYRSLYVHAGGSPQALTYLKSGRANVIDFNQFSHGGNFIRDASRAAPHNLYTDSDKLFLGLKQVAPDLAPTYTSWPFKDETPFDNRPTAVKDLVINFSSFNYKVKYVYDRVNNQYQRFVGDKPHVTRQGDQIVAKDVVVEFIKTGLIAGDKQRLQMELIGSGRMLLFRDGTVTEGTWQKDSASARTKFLDKDGNVLVLNPGPIWIEGVPTDRQVTY